MNRYKKIAILVCVLITALNIVACGQAEKDESAASRQESNMQAVESNVQAEESNVQTVENTEDVNDNDIEEKSEAESIQDEIARVEVKSCEYENADWGSMGQQEMNQVTAQWYQLWDDELNSLWSRLSDELDAETKAKMLDEQRAWIKRKEENVKGAGAAAFGGSLQPQLENSAAEEMTRARAYILAGYLADVRNESFTISPEIQESIDTADPSRNDVFKKFEGQWIFDEERGACVGIERTETCAYGVEGSEWTVWVTGGDIISDLDVYGYTENSIIFKIARDGYDTFYELSFNMANSINFAFGTSLAVMDDVIVCLGNERIAINVKDAAKQYETMSYGEFKKQTGNEAEFYHADRFIGEILDSSLCVVYGGEYDENIAAAVLLDDDMPIRLQGTLNDLMDGIPEEMTLTEFAEALSAGGAAKAVYEILDGGGTAYYVGNTYLQIQFDSDKNGELDRQLLISLDESVKETINPESVAWLELL